MLNPADAAYGLVGVYSPDISELMGESLMRLGMQHALVVHSCGLDELTPMGPAGGCNDEFKAVVISNWYERHRVIDSLRAETAAQQAQQQSQPPG
jgi:anthranilate phosphoribosyltransferase